MTDEMVKRAVGVMLNVNDGIYATTRAALEAALSPETPEEEPPIGAWMSDEVMEERIATAECEAWGPRLARLREENERLAWRVAALETAESHRLAEVRADHDRLRKAAEIVVAHAQVASLPDRNLSALALAVDSLRAALSQTGESG